jgi:hypothetical protein
VDNSTRHLSMEGRFATLDSAGCVEPRVARRLSNFKCEKVYPGRYQIQKARVESPNFRIYVCFRAIDSLFAM